MKFFKKIFGELNITYPKLILWAVIAGVYTGVVAMLPFAKDTSIADISICWEWWVFFGIIIIINSKSPLDSGLKCILFFLISQPLVYLVQVPFSELGWQLFSYYRTWFMITLLTFPMGYVGHFIKKDKWWGLLILVPMLVIDAYMCNSFFTQTVFWFPHHLFSLIFTVATMFLFVFFIFRNRKLKIAGAVICGVLVIAAVAIGVIRPRIYTTDVLTSGGKAGAVFDNSYSAYLEDEKMGEVSIIYEEGIEDYIMRASFKRAGKTQLVLISSEGEKTVYELTVRPDDFDILLK